MQHITITRESNSQVMVTDGTIKRTFPLVIEGHIGNEYADYNRNGEYIRTYYDLWTNGRKPILIGRGYQFGEFQLVEASA